MSKAAELASKYCEGSSFVDACVERPAYIAGYYQAEKDNALTWEDMRELYVIFAEVDVEIELCKADNIESETIGYYQEVLKRFKDFKERKENAKVNV